ncbi:hypothetical protein AMST5_00059 [freshwater sediment metagenome]|uniref:Uncharacterized protein n=1 Tax=freshwater sediment metagenome TaxID=556182 RepID=A0AA48LWS2_9ZZZZ
MPDYYDINDLNAIPGQQVHGVPRGPRADVGVPAASDTTLSTARSFDPAPAYNPAPSGPNPGYIVPNHGDFASRLPPAALAKLRKLKSAVRDLNAVASAAMDRVSDAQMDYQRAEQRVSVLRANNVGGRNDLALKEATAKRDAALAERDGAQAEHDARAKQAAPARNVLLACERYTEREIVSFDGIEPAPVVTAPELRKGQSWFDAVAEVRARIEKHRAERQAAIDAPQPSESAKARARAEIEALAEKGAPSVMALIESPNGGIEWPSSYQLAGAAMRGHEVVGRVGRDGYKFDPLPFSVWLNKAELIKRIEAEIDSRADDRSALDPATRQKKIAQADANRFEAELLEEAIICAAEQAGVVIQRRPDADVRAVLGLSPDLPAPRGL